MAKMGIGIIPQLKPGYKKPADWVPDTTPRIPGPGGSMPFQPGRGPLGTAYQQPVGGTPWDTNGALAPTGSPCKLPIMLIIISLISLVLI